MTRRAWLAALLGSLALASGVGLLAASAWLISRASERPQITYLSIAIVAVRALGIGRGVFRYAERLAGHDAALRQLGQVRADVYQRLAALAPAGLRRFRSGDLLTRLVNDVDSVQDRTVRVLIPVISGVSVAVLTVLAATWLLPAAGLVLGLALLFGATVVPWLSERSTRAVASRTQALRGSLSAETIDLVEGSAELLTSDPALVLDRLASIDEDLRRAESRGARVLAAAGSTSALLQGLAVLVMAIVAVPAVRSGQLDGVNLAVLLLLPLAAYETVVGLPNAAAARAKTHASSRRVTEVLDSPNPVLEPERPLDLPDPGASGYALEVDGLTVRWPGALEPALQDVSLVVEPGRCLGITGPSGSGKSTLVAALMKFLAPEAGDVVLVGEQRISYADLAGDDVRRVISLGEQDPHMFDSTLSSNLRLASPDATQAQLDSMRESLHIGMALDTAIGRHGKAVSGGQRQRVGVARALLANHPILVFDEPTEALDAETAEVVLARVRAASAEMAVIVVSHDSRALEQCDEVIVLDSGRIVDRR